MKTRPWLVAFFQPQEVSLAPAQAQTRNVALLAAVIAGVVTTHWQARIWEQWAEGYEGVSAGATTW